MVKQGFLNLPENEQNAVIEAALDEFAEKDFEMASLNHIIARAGISKGSMYHYFSNKEDLYLYLIELAMKEKEVFLKSELRKAAKPVSKMNFFENLEFQMKSSVDFARKYYRYHQVAVRMQNLPSSEFKETIWGSFETAFDNYVASMVEIAISNREIRSDFGKEFILRILKFFLMRFTEIFPDYRELMKKDNVAIWQEIDYLVQFLRNGLQNISSKEGLQ